MPLMQRHVDIYRHKVIMGVHTRVRRDKNGETIDAINSSLERDHGGSTDNFSAAAELEMN
jgi:hypothetical protein